MGQISVNSSSTETLYYLNHNTNTVCVVFLGSSTLSTSLKFTFFWDRRRKFHEKEAYFIFALAFGIVCHNIFDAVPGSVNVTTVFGILK